MGLRLTLAALGWAAALPAHALITELPSGTLSFGQPLATVATDADIPVWVTLTIDGGSAPLALDAGLPDYGFDPALFDRPGQKWLSVTHASTNTYFACSGTFTRACEPGAYRFDFNVPPGANTFNWQSTITLAPGESLSYLFGTFRPVGGVAPAGTYSFFGSGATLFFEGTGYRAATDADGNILVDADGNTVWQTEDDGTGTQVPRLFTDLAYGHTIADTRWGGGPAFVREVVAVPEPAPFALMLSGLALTALMAYRRQARR